MHTPSLLARVRELEAERDRLAKVAAAERALRTAKTCGLGEWEIGVLRKDLRALGIEP